MVEDPGLIQVIEREIVPRLEQRLPVQADQEQSQADPLRHRFTLVFDREGYSPDFLRRMKKQRIACLTYHKFPDEDWSAEEFAPTRGRLPSGEAVSMDLAERGTCLRNGLWVRELRKRTERGHQTAILCTDYRSEGAPLAVAMFARWSQENFFKYAREHFSLDRLVDYRTEVISEPLRVVNPDYRHLDGQVRSATGRLTRRLAKYAAMTLEETIEPKHVEPFVQRKAALQEEIEAMQDELDTLKTQRKETPHHITVDELPEEARFRQLSAQSKHFVDTIKMSTYLVAFIVGELEVTDPVDVDGIPLRIVYPPGKGNLTSFALDAAAQARGQRHRGAARCPGEVVARRGHARLAGARR